MTLREFLKRAANTPPAVVVQGDEVALGVVRDLGRENVPTLVLTPDRRSPAVLSRYSAGMACADPFLDEDRFITDLETAGAMLPQRGVLFPAHDDCVVAVARHKERLERYFAIPIPAWEHLRTLADKELQVALARRAGVDAPLTAVLDGNVDVLKAAEEVPFPAVLKPSVPLALVRRKGFKAFRLTSLDELPEAYGRFRSCGTLLLQEIIPGDDDRLCIAACYHDARSRPVAVFTGRKLRQHPRGFGVTRLGESRWSPVVAEKTLKLLAEARYHGVSDVEFKLDPRDRRLKLMEVNARQGFWGPLATASGINLSYIAYRDMLGQPHQMTARPVDGVRWADLLRDGSDSLMELVRGELTVREWLRPLPGIRVDAYLSFRDPWPGVWEGTRLGGRLARKLVTKAARRIQKSEHAVDAGS